MGSRVYGAIKCESGSKFPKFSRIAQTKFSRPIDQGTNFNKELICCWHCCCCCRPPRNKPKDRKCIKAPVPVPFDSPHLDNVWNLRLSQMFQTDGRVQGDCPPNVQGAQAPRTRLVRQRRQEQHHPLSRTISNRRCRYSPRRCYHQQELGNMACRFRRPAHHQR